MRRSLTHFRWINLAVLLGAGVATAVLTGALLVGDSVRGSLRDLALERLGRIDHALVAARFFRVGLVRDLEAVPEFARAFAAPVPAILLRGSAVHGATGARSSRVQVRGIEPSFADLFVPEDSELVDGLARKPGQLFPPLVVNRALQRELGAAIGDPVLLSFEQSQALNPEFVFASRQADAGVRTLRFTLARVLPDRGAGRFGLQPHQALPLNAFVPLAVLQKALAQQGRANAVLVAKRDAAAEASTQILRDALCRVWKMDDLGLMLKTGPDYFALESEAFVLPPDLVRSALALAATSALQAQPILTYLANTIAAGDRLLPYSTVSAFDPVPGMPALELEDGTAAPVLSAGEILLNQWAAADLGVTLGDEISLSYFVVGRRGKLSTQGALFRLRGVVAMRGLGADSGLTPVFPGVQDADDMAAWEAPFPVDLSLIGPRDEAYWDRYEAAPKGFVAHATGQQLWRSRFGQTTALRFGPPPGQDARQASMRFGAQLLQKIPPAQVGLVFQPVRARALEAAAGATDFSMLFIGFSLFLIVAAALLVGLLFRLGVEQRAGEIGVLLAAGYPLAAVRRRFFLQGFVLAAAGGLLGLGGAASYAWLLLAGLRSWWLAAVGTPFLVLHLNPWSLALGWAISLLVVLFALGRTLRQCGRIPVRTLLAGGPIQGEKKSAGRARILAFAGLGLGLLALPPALLADAAVALGLFFASGAFLLVGGLAFFSLWLRGGRRQPLAAGALARARLGLWNSARHPGRSLLCAALVGCACFVLVAVGANRRVEAGAALGKESGTGGFPLLATADVPLHQDLNEPEGRFELGFAASDSAILDRAEIVPFRVLPGEDISCLNLYQPQQPGLLGVPDELIQRGGFRFQQTAAATPEERANPWLLLQRELEPGVIPALGDYNSVLWILHLGLGDELVLRNEAGEDLRLRLVGLLKGSLFQSELLISESHFKRHFPTRSGYGYFLVNTPPAGLESVAGALEETLGVFGFDVTSTSARLEAYRAVENTYLSTFQTLGGLGLLLGTVGLGIVLWRNAVERRGELATLRACGFRVSTLGAMLLVENGFLLLVGIVAGSAAALVAVAPHLATPGAAVPWVQLLGLLGLVFLAGMAASGVAAFWALRTPLLPALKAD